MFFENEWISFELLEVIEVKQKNIHIYNSGRNFNALSYRIHSDSVLINHNKKYPMKDNCITFVPAMVDYDRISRKEELIAVHFNIGNCYVKEIEWFIPQDAARVETLFKEILDCWRKKEVGYKYKCSGIFCEILALCHSENHKTEYPKSKIANSVDFLLKHFTDPNLTIGEIAQRSFISEVYFRKIFKREYGISPQKYIVNLRIQNAIGMISAGYYSLSEIAFLSGYGDYKHFSTAFKKQVGVSPSAYSYHYIQKSDPAK